MFLFCQLRSYAKTCKVNENFLKMQDRNVENRPVHSLRICFITLKRTIILLLQHFLEFFRECENDFSRLLLGVEAFPHESGLRGPYDGRNLLLARFPHALCALEVAQQGGACSFAYTLDCGQLAADLAVAAAVAVVAAAAVVAAVVGTDAMAVNLLTQAAVADIANVQIIQVSDKYVSRRIC